MSGQVRRTPAIVMGEDSSGAYVEVDGRRYHVLREAAGRLVEGYGYSPEEAAGFLVQRLLDYLLFDKGRDDPSGEEGAAP